MLDRLLWMEAGGDVRRDLLDRLPLKIFGLLLSLRIRWAPVHSPLVSSRLPPYAMRASDLSLRIFGLVFVGTLLQLASATRIEGSDAHQGSVSRLRRVRRQTPGSCSNG